jgi:adenylyltransferase/sulfurtransferase
MRFREVKLRKNPDCPMCGTHPTIKGLIDYELFCGIGPAAPQPASSEAEEITAVELKRRIDLGQDVQIIDVREPYEFAIARIPNTVLIPLAQIVNRAAEIDPSRETVVYCKVGLRSAAAVRRLKQDGFGGRLLNLKGGILAWAQDVDPSLPRY